MSQVIKSMELLVKSDSRVRVLFSHGELHDKTNPMLASLALPMVKSLVALGADVSFVICD